MKQCLLMRLAGPMQAWGVQSRFTVRETLGEPSKSGIVGLIAAALGYERTDERLRSVASLRMGVRVDREGVVRRDYHTAGRDGFLRASGKKELRQVVVSERYYLADAWFTVGLEGDTRETLQNIYEAIGNPHWLLWLGRKSMPPAAPVQIQGALFDGELGAIMPSFEDSYWREVLGSPPPRPTRLVLEDGISYPGQPLRTMIRPDQPVSFSPRQYRQRIVHLYSMPEQKPETES